MRPVRSLLPVASAVAMIFAFGSPARLALAQDYQGPGAIPDAGTYQGSRQIQEQQQQQEQQFRDQQQQQFNQEQDQQGQQGQQGQQQYYGSQGGYANGPFAAIYLDPRSLKEWGDWNFPSPQAARAAAEGACHKGTGAPCLKVLEFANTCAAFVVSKASHVWAARAASSEALAEDMALTACRKEGGKDCVTRQHYCSPNNWQ
ncbi:MAG TPA: DUF4189 domain-containing protein [Caulobacteraceae bacterium]|nr:DUF4189 domain-containing protein [Caulobacteraceae bacterium]